MTTTKNPITSAEENSEFASAQTLKSVLSALVGEEASSKNFLNASRPEDCLLSPLRAKGIFAQPTVSAPKDNLILSSSFLTLEQDTILETTKPFKK